MPSLYGDGVKYDGGIETLEGRQVSGVLLNQEKDTITFMTDKGPVSYFTEGDCCSVSWIEHLSGLEALDAPILSAEGIEMADVVNNPDEYELVQAYGFRLTTVRGRFEIEMRNRSNGFYGGNLAELIEPVFENMNQVKEDF